MKLAKLPAVVSSSEGAIPKTIEINTEVEIEILLLTEGMITDTESLTGSVKNIIIITRI
jgi:hypothetical protein